MAFRRWLITLLLLLLIIGPSLKSSEAKVRVDWEVLGTFKLEKEPLDIVLSLDGKVAYILTKGSVVIYSAEENRVIERIPVDGNINHIWVSPRGNLIYLTNTESKELSVVRLDFSLDIKRGNSISLGPEDSPVTLVAFMDFQCPFCSEVFSILSQVLDQYPDEVNLIFKHFPLKDHIYAEKAALASVSAYKQGKFLDMAEIFFENCDKFEGKTVDQASEQIGLDMELFRREMETESAKEILYEDVEMGQRLKIRGVPTIFINGKKVNNRFLPNLPEMVFNELSKHLSENPPRKGTIAGRVTDERGKPISCVAVAITSGSAPFPDIAASTNEQGEYQFSNISEGTFEIAVHKKGYSVQKKTVTVKYGDVSQLHFEMPAVVEKAVR